MNNLENKKTGAHYTPDDLSFYLAKELREAWKKNSQLEHDNLRILDPSCGNGNLLLAIQNVFKDLKYKAIGIDINQSAIKEAQKKLNNSFELINADYLKGFESLDDQEDLIIANPPYVRTSVLGAGYSQQLSKKFNLSGKLDMYQVFFKAMTRSLREGGILCAITSNKYLTNKTGKDIRNFLTKNFEIIKIIDLGDTRPFSAAVLPAIFIGKKKKGVINKNIPFVKTYETQEEVTETRNVDKLSRLLNQKNGVYKFKNMNFKVTRGSLDTTSNSSDPWNMATIEEKKWANKLEKNAAMKFSDVFDVRVGIKTTADKVFIKDNWESLDDNLRPERKVLHKLISAKKLDKWSPNPHKLNEILYTHTMELGKRVPINLNNFPHAKNYLLSHKEELSSRRYVAKANRNWFEIWVPQCPDKLLDYKVVFPDISEKAKFAYDDNGFFVDGNCYWLTTKDNIDNDYLLLATGVANSCVMEKYYDIKFQNVLYNGRKRYLTQYVKNYLLPDINNDHSKNVIKLVKELIRSSKDIRELEEKVDEEVKRAFNLV